MNCINTTGGVTHTHTYAHTHKPKDTHWHTLAHRHTYRENKVYFSLFQSRSLFDTQCTVSLFHPIQTALTPRNARIHIKILKWTDTVQLQL